MLTGCSPSTEPTPSADGGADGSRPAGDVEREYCTPLAALLCERGRACGCGEILPGESLDLDACAARLTAECLRTLAGVIPAIARGEARFRPEAARACLERIARDTPPCARPSAVTVLAACEPLVTDVAAIGRRCSDVSHCADGAGVCTEGTCVPRRALGDPCRSSEECASGLLCVGAICRRPATTVGERCTDELPCAPPLQCIEGSCARLAEAGAACATSADCAVGASCMGGVCTPRAGATCVDDDDCGNLSSCVRVRACSPPAGLGEPCAADAECTAGTYCDATTGVCAALPGEGEPCAREVLCAPGLGCDPDAGTICRVPGGEGSRCLLSEFGFTVCRDGLGCRADAGSTCGALGREGEPCTVDHRCAEDLGCAFEATGTVCRVLRGVDEPCGNDQVCASGLHCDYTRGRCAPKRESGPCAAGNECVGVCAPGSSGGFECAPRPGLGQPCIFENDCAPGLACRSEAMGVCLDAICGAVL
jgi:hypothetical protein